MPPWSIAAFVAAVFFALHYLTLRAATGRIGDGLGALCIEGAAAVGLLALFLARVTPRGATTSAGLFWACASGLCISGTMALLFSAIRMGGPVSSTGTIVLGGGVAISALAAPLIYGEGFSLRRGLGVLLGVVAMAILATEKR